MKQIYKIGELPFYYTALRQCSNPEGLPDRLSFYLTQDDKGCIRQYPSAREQELLDTAYRKGSQISGFMDDNGLGRHYADDFLRFINENYETAGKKILEIGCGTGYLLYRLSTRGGVKVLGIEPGIHGAEGKKKYGIPVIHDFFDPSKITDTYDMVVFFGVLEHMPDPEQFLRDVKSVMCEDGRIFLSVPDCEPYIRTGDLSMLIHEHWSYFTKKTLQALAVSCGLAGEIVPSEFGGSLYAALSVKEDQKMQEYSGGLTLAAYIRNVELQKEKVTGFVESVLEKQTLGIYVPGRMINILSVCFDKIPEQIRFFDDNGQLYKTFFPGIDIPVENFQDLRHAPVDVMLIASDSFGSQIKEKLVKHKAVEQIVLLKDL